MKTPSVRRPIAILIAACLSATVTVRAATETTTQTEMRSEVQVVTVDSNGVTQSYSSGQPGKVILKKTGGADGKVVEHVEAFAFDSTGGPAGEVDMVVSNAIGGAFSYAFSTGGAASPMMAKAMKNAPYSAEVINERVQVLPDGNQIVKRSTSFTARDSAGRTRSETRDDAGLVKSISIVDPIDGQRLVLVPQAKTATKFSFDKDFSKRIEEIRDRAKKMASESKDGKVTIVEGSPGNEVRVYRSDSAPNANTKESREEVRVVVSSGKDGKARTETVNVVGPTGVGVNSAMASLRAGSLGSSFQDAKFMRSAVTKDLGTKEIDGVRVDGKMRSYTIPAGEIGNKSAITVSTESWASPDLGITVYSKHSDPRSGETIYRLANLKRGEQPMSLFTAPEGYTVKELPGVSLGGSAAK